MGRRHRWGGGDKTPPVKPVERVELSDKHFRGRLIAVVLLIALAATSFAVGIHSCISQSAGWQIIEGADGDGLSCRADFSLQYDIGRDGADPTAEYRALNNLWTEITAQAYTLFSATAQDEKGTNLAAVNAHPNVDVQVDPDLYSALCTLVASGDRTVYLGPVVGYYESLLTSQDASYDPYGDAAIGAFCREVATYAQDTASIRLELRGEDTVRLCVGEAYLQYAAEEEITRFLDLGWMQNAFIADYLADRLLAHGYTHGTLTSYDGFTRTLDNSTSFSGQLYEREGDTLYYAASFSYTGSMALVECRAFAVTTWESTRFYQAEDGSMRSLYLSAMDGLCHTALDDLFVYAADGRCASLALAVAPLYCTDAWGADVLLSVTAQGNFGALWCEGTTVYQTGAGVALASLGQYTDRVYVAQQR